MNDPICWDPSLVKKFNSSNHFKLLNQLRNEVKKYPLNNKKKQSTIQTADTCLDNKNKSTFSNAQKSQFSTKVDPTNEVDSSKSTVSFNNSKNFSIYNQSENNNITHNNNSFLTDISRSNEDVSTQTFKERLNQIDMK